MAATRTWIHYIAKAKVCIRCHASVLQTQQIHVFHSQAQSLGIQPYCERARDRSLLSQGESVLLQLILLGLTRLVSHVPTCFVFISLSTSNEAIISSVCKCNATPPTQSLLHLITRRQEIVLGNPLDLPVRRLRCLHFDWKMHPRAVLALVLHEWRFPQQIPTSLLQTCHLKITAIPRTKPTDLPFLYKPDLSMPSVVSRSYFMRSIGSECWQVVTKQYILIP